jgi:HD-like signal output (HDOD) protein
LSLNTSSANSAVSASQTAIGSLQQAVVRIGAARVLEIAVRGALGERLAATLDLYELDGAERKTLAVAASAAAAVVSAASPVSVSRDVVCAALLHGIGMDVIDTVADPDAAGPLRRAGVPRRQMEHELVAADHAEVGGFVLRRWGLPDTLVDAVERQHDPSHSPEAACVCLAIDLAAELLHGDGDTEVDPVMADAIDALELSDRLEQVRNAVRATLDADGLLGEGD